MKKLFPRKAHKSATSLEQQEQQQQQQSGHTLDRIVNAKEEVFLEY
jgi:hypothetical protein